MLLSPNNPVHSLPRSLLRPKVGAGLLALALLSGCNWIINTDRIVLAEMKGDRITQGMLEEEIASLPIDQRTQHSSREGRLTVLRGMVQRAVLALEAESRGLKVLPAEVDAIVSRQKRQMQGAMFDPDVSASKSAHTSRERSRREIEKELLVRKVSELLQREAAQRINLTQNDMVSYYEKHSEEFKVPHFALRYLVVTNSQIASDVANRARRMGNFVALMQDVISRNRPNLAHYSHPSGQPIYIREAELPPNVKNQLEQLEDGMVGGPVGESGAYWVFQRIAKVDSIPMQVAAPQIQQRLVQETRQKTIQQTIDDLNQKYDAVIHEDRLMSDFERQS